MTRVIELNDAGIRLGDAGGVHAESPGYAVVDARRLLVGEAARREARLDPRHTTSRFWAGLSMDPVQNPHASARTQADLAHAHLLQLWEAAAGDDDDVIFAVPGHYDRAQMALLLGIARECPFRTVGLVDAAVAAVAAAAPDFERVVHLDALLHQGVLTRLDGDGAWQRIAVSDVPAVGLAGLRDAWVAQIADAFVRETRFDPLHDAGTEQRLYDQLDDWIDALADTAEVTVELDTAAHVWRVTLDRAHLISRVAPRYEILRDHLTEALAAAPGSALLLAPRLARLPGLVEHLAGDGRLPVLVQDEDATLRGALAHEAEIRHDDEALRFVTRLPRRTAASRRSTGRAPPADTAAPAPQVDAADEPATRTAAAPGDAVTHVLLEETAWPLTGDALEIGGADGLAGDRLPARLARLRRDGDDWILEPEGAGRPGPLAAGESRVLGPERVLLTLIRVVPEGA